MHGLYGTVRIRRAYYATGSGAGLAPLDEQLGIGGGQTPACGAVESACKNVAARMKRSGMTWTLAGAKHLLQLRVSLMSSRFDRDFRRSLPALPDLHDLPAAA